ncbi:MAG: LuxR C-terminal-related transcriptional regulator, partial [Chloroflexi bacterium]|nr:LuxR C-terminal-related transcriptional regulator [Chloroflexota bacterium]MCI0649808.1 LuxR C-terminal-related transcriptional regulator [Chloroflexota bacterium]MCI0730517.1 LuxR C-terminal-related transcriptional regulator [Chloroflexota bacterium]
ELGPQHPVRIVLGDLATSTATRRLTLSPLSAQAVRTLAGRRAFDPVALHRQTGGNPFFVTEVLAAESSGIPLTVRDAVLARAARLSPSARAVLDAAAVIGARVEPWLLAEVTGAEAGAAGECLAIGMLVAQGEVLAFRHELARQTILDALSPHHRLVLNQLVLDALKAAPSARRDLARLAHHAEAAGDREAVLEFAPAAARQAATASAHRQAAALYALALRFAADLPAAGRAPLLESYATECFLIDQQAEGLATRRKLLELWRQAGNVLKQGETFAHLATLLVIAGQNAEAEQASQAAIELLEQLPPGRELALAYRVRATLHLVNRDCRQAIYWAEKALSLARRFGDAVVEATAHNVIGTAWLFVDYPRGCEYLEQRIASARAAGLEARAATAYSNLASGSGELYQFAQARHYLAEGIAYTGERDLDYHRLYMVAWLALTRLYLGYWDEAGRAATEVLQCPDLSAISRIVGLVALGRLHARRGDPGAPATLDEALELARQAESLQRLGPVHAARAEAAWLAGDRERTRREARAAYDLAVSKQHPWFAGELAFWRWRAGDEVAAPEWLARPFALHIAGNWRAAAGEWQRLGCPYEQARALADGDQAAQIAALEIFDRLGARPAAEGLRQQMRAAGVRIIPRGPRPATRENPFGLTARQMEILVLLAENLTNAEIAAQLHLSPKTVDHHVSAVLARLDVHSREAAAELARQHPLLKPLK